MTTMDIGYLLCWGRSVVIPAFKAEVTGSNPEMHHFSAFVFGCNPSYFPVPVSPFGPLGKFQPSVEGPLAALPHVVERRIMDLLFRLADTGAVEFRLTQRSALFANEGALDRYTVGAPATSDLL